MQVEVKVEYQESYYPTPRSRKIRYRDATKMTNIEVREVTKEQAPVAFIVNAYGWEDQYGREIRYYNGEFYAASRCRKELDSETILLPLEELHYHIRGSYAWWLNKSYEESLAYFEEDAKRFLIVDGVAYERIGEPRYVVNTFGLGHNHGGTGMFVHTFYNGNIGKDNYFSALEPDKAIAYANMVAERRGDTRSVGTFKKMIEVLMPEVVSVDPQSQHGDGDEFMNQIEALVNTTDSAAEAGLLTMVLLATKQI